MSLEGVSEGRELVVNSPLPILQNRLESTVHIHVTHSNLKAKFFELRLDKHVRSQPTTSQNKSFRIPNLPSALPFCSFSSRQISQMTIESLKVKLSFHVGTSPSSMLLQLLDEGGQLQALLLDDTKPLGVGGRGRQGGWLGVGLVCVGCWGGAGPAWLGQSDAVIHSPHCHIFLHAFLSL